DLAISLEVAEHLPEDAAETFVRSLTRTSSVILFSAAIPHQGGEQHLNEQWPDYWAAKFARHRYQAVDCLRSRLWNSPDVAWCYSQNILFFAADQVLVDLQSRAAQLPPPDDCIGRLVHPGNYYQGRWRESMLQAAIEVAGILPPNEPFLLIDDGQFPA